MTLLVDTNVWIATRDERDPDHQRCVRVLRDRAGELVAPPTVVAETAWFLEDRYGPAAEADFVRLITSGALAVIDLTEQDWRRCVELIETYDKLSLGLVDASIVAVAERLGLTELATKRPRFHRCPAASRRGVHSHPDLRRCDLRHVGMHRYAPLRTAMHQDVLLCTNTSVYLEKEGLAAQMTTV